MSKNISTFFICLLYFTLIKSLTADGEQTVLRFRPEEEYSNMNCEIDGKYQ